MTEFEGVTVVKNANIYFDGRVFSRTVLFSDGSRKTLGIFLPGEFEFNTDKKEILEILSGGLEFSLSGEDEWKKVQEGETFEVPAQSTFYVKVTEITDYCCSYIGD